jgi:hypothetical protein
LATGNSGVFEILDFPTIEDSRGDLTFIEASTHLPFRIARVYFLHNVPSASDRGGHAHRALQQVILPLAGSFTVDLDDGSQRASFSMNNPRQGLLLGSMVWRELRGFTKNSICLVLASQPYDEEDYIRDYQQFSLEARRLR